MMKKLMNIFYAGLIVCGTSANTACSEEKFGPDPDKDWAGTTEFFNSVDVAGFQTYYNPAVGRCFICRNTTTMVLATIHSGVFPPRTELTTSLWVN